MVNRDGRRNSLSAGSSSESLLLDSSIPPEDPVVEISANDLSDQTTLFSIEDTTGRKQSLSLEKKLRSLSEPTKDAQMEHPSVDDAKSEPSLLENPAQIVWRSLMLDQ